MRFICSYFYSVFSYILLFSLIHVSSGFVCASQNKIGHTTETCPTMFGNHERIFCCEQLDGTVFCCDYDEYIRNRGKRRKFFNEEDLNQRKNVYEDDSMDNPWWFLDWIMYIVPILQIGVCIICCVCRCSPCCKQRRPGIVYRIQPPTAIVNVQPFGPTPGILPSQASMPIVTPTSGSLPVPQPAPSPVSLLQPPSFQSHHVMPQAFASSFEEPPPPYSEVVREQFAKQIP